MREEMIITIIIAVVGSSGLWAFLQFLLTNSKKSKRKEDLVAKLDRHESEIKQIKAMSLGALYDRAKFLGESYLKRGWWTLNEYEDYKHYIYQPYHDAGGDGTIDKIMRELEKMPIEASQRSD